MACLCDAYGSAYYRRKPLIDDDDYDIDFYTVDQSTAGDGPSQNQSSREQLEVSTLVNGHLLMLTYLPGPS